MGLPSPGDRSQSALEICPGCRGDLSSSGPDLLCLRCRRRFAHVGAIPDLRLTPDEGDLSRARILDASFQHFDFAGLLRENERLLQGSPSQNPALHQRYIARYLTLARASGDSLAAIEQERGIRLDSSDRFLEVGCGTGALAAVAAGRGAQVVATDISMRALVLAKKRLAEAGVTTVRLVCCAAEQSGFAPASFDVVAASDVIEHTPRPEAFLAACCGLLAPGGILFLATPNRFSVWLEPHVRLWGVGFLPRVLARRYVRAVRKISYEGIRPLSVLALRKMLASHELAVKIVIPEIPAATQELYTGFELGLVRAYNRSRGLRLLRPILLGVGPFFHVFGKKKCSPPA